MNIYRQIIILTLMAAAVSSCALSASAPAEAAGAGLLPFSCTIFVVSRGDTVFFGNNEDWKDPDTWYWVEPAGEDRYGALYFGYGNLFPQGGINEAGLAYDANALPRVPVSEEPGMIRPTRAIVNRIIMKNCATVEEAIETARSYFWGPSFAGQFLVADASGDAVVISIDSEGRLAFTRKEPGDGFLVSTNFNRAWPASRYGGYPCDRYEATVRMLEGIDDGRVLSVEYLASILDEVHAEGPRLNTLYSNIFDLKEGLVYLYYWHRFDEPVVLDAASLIEKEQPPARISSLFTADAVGGAERELGKYKRIPRLLFGGWLVLVAGSVLFIILRKSHLKRSDRGGSAQIEQKPDRHDEGQI